MKASPSQAFGGKAGMEERWGRFVMAAIRTEDGPGWMGKASKNRGGDGLMICCPTLAWDEFSLWFPSVIS